MTLRLAVFASGTGSNFVAIAQAIDAGKVDAELALLFCDNPNAPVITRAAEMGIPSLAIAPADCANRVDYETRIREALDESQIQLVALAGYMRIVGAPLLESYEGRIINIHPSLLPAFPGRHAIEDAWVAGVSETGVSIHYVDEGIDTGPLIAQQRIPILPGETCEELENRIHRVEHRLYPDAIQTVIGGFNES